MDPIPVFLMDILGPFSITVHSVQILRVDNSINT